MGPAEDEKDDVGPAPERGFSEDDRAREVGTGELEASEPAHSLIRPRRHDLDYRTGQGVDLEADRIDRAVPTEIGQGIDGSGAPATKGTVLNHRDLAERSPGSQRWIGGRDRAVSGSGDGAHP